MKIKSYWLKLAAGLILIALLLLFKVKLADVGVEIRHSDPTWILLAGALHIIGLLLSAYRWQLLLSVHQVQAPMWDLFRSYLIGGFFNNFLPTRVGGDVYRMVDSKKYSGSLLRPFAVIVVERLSGIFGLLLIGVTAFSFYPRLEEIRSIGYALVGLMLGGLAFILVFYGSDRFAGLLKKLTAKLPEKIGGKLLAMFDAFWHFSTSKGTVFFVFVLGLLLQLNVILYYYFIALGLGMDLTLTEVAIVMPLLICIQLLPLTPNGIGVREVTYVALLSHYFNIANAAAVAFSVWDYILTFAYGLIGGLLYLLKKE